MAEWKQKEAALDADPSETLPPYSIEDSGHSLAGGSSAPASVSGRQDGTRSTSSSGLATTSPPAPPAAESIVDSKTRLAAAERARSTPTAAAGPTAAEPFNFPSDATLPPYSPADTGAGPGHGAGSPPSSTSGQLPIVIPQVRSRADSPFLSAYSQDLLRYGIPQDTWLSFVDTLSAFLTANVSEKALSHAADIGRQISDVPTDLGRSIADSAKSVGRGIAQSAKKGNIFGVATGLVGGAIGLTVGTGLKLAASATTLPGKAAIAVMSPPQTPGERAAAYALVANGKWLGQRGLMAQVLNSMQVAQLLGVSMEKLLQDTQAARAQQGMAGNFGAGGLSTNATPLEHLRGVVADLDVPVDEDAGLSPTMSGKSPKASTSATKNDSKHLEELGQATIWLVVTQDKYNGQESKGKSRNDDMDKFGLRGNFGYDPQDYGRDTKERRSRDRRRRRDSTSKDRLR
ncbi:uncharacterized protein B0I36DRAFT_327400 [Microdochium trichocladiopsis]|uniref:Uncharacterized protein n=1 Tax=Microdochium trichocladiopsis TaxID=1682393 RepID=A0A9P9BNM6_9PEZI|nr:uncharacterized protein B0I36DRAFT_327400 [Microdochium trichocladiopsis]KAH7027579.1 hypothetical protein B0I36DRAFT_327400 [Microdochium trichocladiopsis]